MNIKTEITDIPPEQFGIVPSKMFFESAIPVSTPVVPTSDEVTFNNSGTPAIINVTFTTPWSAA